MQILAPPLHLHPSHGLLNDHFFPPKSSKCHPFNRATTNKSLRRSIRCCTKKNIDDKRENDQKTHSKQEKRFDTFIKKETTNELPELLGDESPNFSFSLPAMLILHGKEQVFGMLSPFISFLKRHIEFVVRPTAGDAVDIGLRWHIEWKGNDLHLAPGCSLDMNHVYNGKIFLRNGKALLDLLLCWKPSKLKSQESLGNASIDMLQKMASKYVSGEKNMLLSLYCFFYSLIFMAIVFMLKNTFNE